MINGNKMDNIDIENLDHEDKSVKTEHRLTTNGIIIKTSTHNSDNQSMSINSLGKRNVKAISDQAPIFVCSQHDGSIREDCSYCRIASGNGKRIKKNSQLYNLTGGKVTVTIPKLNDKTGIDQNKTVSNISVHQSEEEIFGKQIVSELKKIYNKKIYEQTKWKILETIQAVVENEY